MEEQELESSGERTRLACVSGLGGFLSWEKRTNLLHCKENRVILQNRLGLHLEILWEHLLISVYPLPEAGRIPR